MIMTIPFYRTPILDFSRRLGRNQNGNVPRNPKTKQELPPQSSLPSVVFLYLRRRASRSDSRRQRISSTRTAGHVDLANARGARRLKNRTWALDVADDGAGLVVHELNANLGDTTTRTWSLPRAVSKIARTKTTISKTEIAYRFCRERG